MNYFVTKSIFSEYLDKDKILLLKKKKKHNKKQPSIKFREHVTRVKQNVENI